MDFADKVKEWVLLDNQIKANLERIKILRMDKKGVTQDILSIADTQNLGNMIIEITDGKLKVDDYKIITPLIFKLITHCFEECLEN